MKFRNLISLFLLLIILSCTVSAAGPIDLSQTAQLHLTAQCGELSIEGLEFSLYRISSIDETGELSVLPRFAAYEELVNIRGKNDAQWQESAQTLENEILQNALTPDTSVFTSDGGIAVVEDLPLGLYLVLPSGVVLNGYVYSAAPFFLLLPEQSQSDNTWNYTVSAAPKISIEPVLANFEVIKIWKDSCHSTQRPDKITVRLWCGGTEYDTVTLPINGRWQYTWKNLDTNHKWSVTEDPIDGYNTSDITQNGYTFTITNTCTKPDEPTKPNLPQTGQLWWPVPVLLLSGMTLLLIGLLRRRGDADA